MLVLVVVVVGSIVVDIYPVVDSEPDVVKLDACVIVEFDGEVGECVVGPLVDVTIVVVDNIHPPILS